MKLKLSKENVALIKVVSDDIDSPSAVRDETLNSLLQFSLTAAVAGKSMLELDTMQTALLTAVSDVYDGDLTLLCNLLLGIGLTEILGGSLKGLSQEAITTLVGDALAAEAEDFIAEVTDEV